MNNHVIKIPKTVENDYTGFLFLANVFSSTKGFQRCNIELDFSKTRWFEANLASVLGAWVEEKVKNHCTIVLNNLTASVERIFKKNGFYEKYNLGTIEDTYNSTIRYEVFTINQVDDFSTYVTEKVIPKIRLKLTNSVMKSFKLSLNEIFVNVKLHAGSQKVYTCGQYYHTNRKVAFTITDLGNTIGYNVRDKLGDMVISDSMAIDWATKYGHTTKEHLDQGGIGLHIIDEFLTENKGIFQIISGNGYWENHEGKINQYNMDYFFPGTVVNIITKLENTFIWNDDILF